MTVHREARRPLPGARLLVSTITLGLCLVLTAGCGLLDPLRPGTARAEDTTFSVVFDDTLNLPEGAPVKAGGVTVGNVTGIGADGYRATVEISLRPDDALPRDTEFRLRYTTALGELYVEATPHGDGPAIGAGDVIEGPQVTTAPTVEDTLASASLLVNGGGLGQLQTIVGELNLALEGRTGTVRGVIGRTDEFLVQVLRSTRQVDRALGALVDASGVLRRRQHTLNRALRDLRPAARVLTDNTDDLVRLLDSTDRLALTAEGLIKRTRSDLRSIVLQLGPVLETVLAARDRLVPGLDQLTRWGRNLDGVVTTDYLNQHLTLHAVPAELPDVPGLDDLPGTPQGVPGRARRTDPPSGARREVGR